MNPKDFDALDAALDQLVAGEPVDASHPLAAVAARAREALVSEVPAGVQARHLEALSAGAAVVPIRSTRRRAVTILLAATIGATLLGGTAVAASSSALPGQPLYGLKRATEAVQLALHPSASSKARLHLEFAERRLSELSTLLDLRREGEDVDIAAAMRAYRADIAHVADDAARFALGQDFDALLARIVENLQTHVDRLTFIRDNRVPDQAKDAVQRAIDNAQNAEAKIGHGRSNQNQHGKPASAPGKDAKPSTPASSHAPAGTPAR